MQNLPNPPKVPMVTFDTLAIEPEHRFDAWRENIGVFFDLAAADGGRPDTDVRARIDACNLGETVFGVTRAGTQLFKRDAARIGDGMDHILVQVFLEGGGTAETGAEIKPGDMLVIDLGRRHAMVNTDFANLTLVLPRDVNPDLSDILSPLHARRLGSENPMVRFMGDHMQALWKSVPDMDMLQAAGALQGTLGLMEGWLSRDGLIDREPTPEVSAAIGKSIKVYLEKNLSLTLPPQELANTFNISRSQLYRIFEPHGGVGRYIWERRMQRALRMLSQTQFTNLSIGSVAFSCGFTSEAHFSRSFKSRFGQSPSRIRAGCLDAATSARQGPDGSDEEHMAFVGWIRELGNTRLLETDVA
jgi:AraC-like DNA-binding protein